MSMYKNFVNAGNWVKNIISTNPSMKDKAIDLFFETIETNSTLHQKYDSLVNSYYNKYNNLRKAKRIVNSTLARCLSKDLKLKYSFTSVRSEYTNVANGLTESYSILN